MGDFFNEKFFFSSKDRFKTVGLYALVSRRPLTFEPERNGNTATLAYCSRCHEQVVGLIS